MGPGGWIWIAVVAVAAAVLSWKHLRRRNLPAKEDGRLPAPLRVFERAPSEMTEGLTPPWQVELTRHLKEAKYAFLGDFSYSSEQFFWARVFLTPDRKAAVLLVNWVEGGKNFKQVVTNGEIYSFLEGGGFLLTAASQDGAARLLTGADRPPEESLSLALKPVVSGRDVWDLLESHATRLREREARGGSAVSLEPADALKRLSGVFG